MRPQTTIEFYDNKANELAAKYETLSFEQVHSKILKFLPATPALLLDVGAGSGRDASALAERGFSVVAAEPSRTFREIGKRLHPSPTIVWVNDTLPELKKVLQMGKPFDAILCSAVLMHLDKQEQALSMNRLASLLTVSGRLFVTFRTRETHERHSIFDITSADVIRQAQVAGLKILQSASTVDYFRRSGVAWHSIFMEKITENNNPSFEHRM